MCIRDRVNIEKPKEEEENEILTKMKEFTGFYNKKIPTIRNIAAGIKKWDKDNIQKNQIDNVKNELNSIKSRTAGEFTSLKRDIINLDTSQKELFDNITRYEQSFERDIFQMLQLCEQKRLNRINIPELEKRLSLKDKIKSIESDADMCAWGEEFGEKGAFRNIQNAYYIGGGTGTADGLKLQGKLISFDDASEWIAKVWELMTKNKTSLELFSSMSGINQLRLSKSDKEIGEMLGNLIYERINTIYSGWKNTFDVELTSSRSVAKV